MTNKELNAKLYKKLFAEQEEYKGWLLTQPPQLVKKGRQRRPFLIK